MEIKKDISINAEIERLIEKYSIDSHYPSYAKYKKAVCLLKKITEKLNGVNNLLVVGSSQTDINYFLKDSELLVEFETLVCDVDSSDKFEGINFEKFETVIVISYYWRCEIISEINRIGCLSEIISLYDHFELENLYLEGNYYDVFRNKYHAFYVEDEIKTDDYDSMDIDAICFYDRRCYECATDIKVKQYYLEKLIFDFTYMRDFVSLEKCIDIYYSMNFVRDSQNFNGLEYKDFLNDIHDLLDTIRKTLEKRKHKDVFMFWLDALEYGEDYDMDYLKSLSKTSLVFENAYTVTPYTQATAKCLFCNSYAVDDKAYKIERISKKTSKLINNLEDHGYTFRYYGELYGFDKSTKPNKIINFYTPATMIWWEGIAELIQSEKPMFILFHEISQTHSPFISAGLTGDKYAYREFYYVPEDEMKLCELQRKESRKYIDVQLKFYSNLLSEYSYKIYMSDHGHTHYGRYHTIFKVCQKNIENKIVNEMFSYIKFRKFIEYLLEFDRAIDFEKDILQDHVIIQDVDYYSALKIKYVIETKKLFPQDLVGYQGVITKEDRYIRYNNGYEEYFKTKNDGILITKERVAYLKSITHPYNIDVESDKKFEYSKYTYRVLRNYERRNGEYEDKKRAAIIALFNRYSKNTKIAIRGGGRHTLKLLMTLPWEQKKRISYIIDNDAECLAGHVGIKVIGFEDIKNIDIDVIVVSSFEYGTEWKEELEQLSYKISVVDLYDYLRQEGFHCNKAFYYSEYIDSDFDVDFPKEIFVDKF